MYQFKYHPLWKLKTQHDKILDFLLCPVKCYKNIYISIYISISIYLSIYIKTRNKTIKTSMWWFPNFGHGPSSGEFYSLTYKPGYIYTHMLHKYNSKKRTNTAQRPPTGKAKTHEHETKICRIPGSTIAHIIYI